VSLRRPRRAVALGLVLASCVIRLWLARLRGPFTLDRRALWVQDSSQRILAALGIRCCVEGTPPTQGLVVANHLSYLDILCLSAPMPCFFVSKAEVERWPFFGMGARAGGTIFIDRSSRASAEEVTEQISKRLEFLVPILFFPEGTSSDGKRVLHFHSRLFQAAVTAGAPVTAASIRYVIDGDTPEHELCWFGDEAFLPHLWRTLGTSGFTAEVRFGEPQVYLDRRAAAEATHAEISAMRSGSALASR
jgi:lyso-ornithine lipid O-acyltransferase